jgi:hypothetical protein
MPMRSNSQPIPKRPFDLAGSTDVINFYSAPAQRRRAIAALGLPHSRAGLVLAAPRSDISFFSEELRLAGVPIIDVNLVEVTPDWHRAVGLILDACLHAQQRHRTVHLLADFGGNVHYGAIFQLESLLRSATREWNVRCITQYDARQFSEAIDVEALSRLATVLFGDYYRKQVQPRRDSSHDQHDSETANISGD